MTGRAGWNGVWFFAIGDTFLSSGNWVKKNIALCYAIVLFVFVILSPYERIRLNALTNNMDGVNDTLRFWIIPLVFTNVWVSL